MNEPGCGLVTTTNIIENENGIAKRLDYNMVPREGKAVYQQPTE